MFIVILNGNVALSLMVRSVLSSDVPKINGPLNGLDFELVEIGFEPKISFWAENMILVQ